MQGRAFAAWGMGLHAVMQVIFFLSGADRGPLYLTMQVLGAVGSLAAAYGLARAPRGDALAALSAGLAVNGVSRGLQMALGLSRLPLWLNAALTLTFFAAALGAGAWAAGRRSQARLVRACFWLLGAGYLVSVMTVFSRAPLQSVVALALGTVGLWLSAPHVRSE